MKARTDPGRNADRCLLVSGYPVRSVDDVAALTSLVRAHRQLGLQSGLVVVNPPPTEHAMTRTELEALTGDAIRAAPASFPVRMVPNSGLLVLFCATNQH